ncbi:hypothetical protein PVAP13_8KG399566 [Panicum virgatum]|uniref:Uncharacterized protein n=1 Tax=Panicum virgatum TaxID=38727 RepID=A0A8T0PKD0_PANVG|nr:hypothetical protein PVAP13_8KG399566 [Panicum virgatum]
MARPKAGHYKSSEKEAASKTDYTFGEPLWTSVFSIELKTRMHKDEPTQLPLTTRGHSPSSSYKSRSLLTKVVAL